MLSAVVVVLVASAQAPQLDTALRALIRTGDDSAIAAAVRRRPDAARVQLSMWIDETARSPVRADSVLALARRLARAYVGVWDDSFPLTNLERFERMPPAQRVRKSQADSVRLAGNDASEKQGMQAAIRVWRQALRRSSLVPDTAGMAGALGNIGTGYYRQSQLDSADKYFARSRELALAVGDKRTASNALGGIGDVAMDRGDLSLAEATIRRALDMRGQIGHVRGAAADHTNLGLIAADLGDASAARAHYNEALTIAREHSLDEAAAAALLNLANLASEDGSYAEAEAHYRDALALYQALGNDTDAGLVLHNAGLLGLRRGDYRLAKDRLARALRIFTEAGTVEDLIRIRRDMASLDAAMGDLKSALLQLRRAEALASEHAPDDQQLHGDLALARADVSALLNTFTVADQQYSSAQAAYRRAGDAVGEAEAMQGHAMLLIERQLHGRALELLQATRRAQRAGGARRSAALSELMIGYAYREQRNFAAARASVQRALDTLRALPDPVGEGAALVELGEIELSAGSPLASEAHFRSALARLTDRRAPTVTWQAHAGLGRALRARGAVAEGVVELSAAITEVERIARSLPLAERRATYLSDKWATFADLALAERAKGDISAAFVTSERMRARQMLDVLARGRVVVPSVSDTALRAREQDLRFRIGELTQRLEAEEGVVRPLRGPGLTGSVGAVTREALAQVQDQYARLQVELRDASGIAEPMAGSASDWRAVARQLSATQALLTYFVTDSTTFVFVLRPDSMQMLDLSVSRKRLTSLVGFARDMIGQRSTSGVDPWRAPLLQLHRYLIAPIEDGGLLSGVRQLVVVPHGELHYLPFAALIRRGERDEYLVERYDVSYAPSATIWLGLGARATARGAGVLALAPKPEQLRGSRAEVEAIRALYGKGATVILGARATEEVLRSTAASYDIVHLATYGVLNQHNPLFSFVELGRGGSDDGRLEVHEVPGLSLKARLLVLSACQTALASGAVSDVPAGDDWVGLVRAFLGAGAHNVVATLWAVEDRSTAAVMERLHRRLQAGDSESVALSAAQRETLRKTATSSPFHWAGFVLVGGR